MNIRNGKSWTKKISAAGTQPFLSDVLGLNDMTTTEDLIKLYKQRVEEMQRTVESLEQRIERLERESGTTVFPTLNFEDPSTAQSLP